MTWWIALLLLCSRRSFILSLSIVVKLDSFVLKEPERAKEFLSKCFVTNNFQAVSKFVQLKGIDLSETFCELWRKHGNLSRLKSILQSKLPPEDVNALLNPDYLMSSDILCKGLNKGNPKLFSTLPFSFLEAEYFRPAQLSSASFDVILADALKRHLKNRNMKWSEWLLSSCLSTTGHLQRQWAEFYLKKGFMFINPFIFHAVDDKLQQILLQWIYSRGLKCSKFELYLRRLLFAMIYELAGDGFRATRRCIALRNKLRPNELIHDEKTLFKLIYSLRHKSTPNIHGDWLVGILYLWREVFPALSQTRLTQFLDLLFIHFPPTIQGTGQLIRLNMDPRIMQYIYNREGEQFLAKVFEKCPEIPVPPLPFKRRWEMFSKGLRRFMYQDDWKVSTETSFELIWDLVSRRSLPHGRGDVERILTSVFSLDWFDCVSSEPRTVVPNARMPRMAAKWLGFYLVLARVYHLEHPIRLDSSFLLLPNTPPESSVQDNQDDDGGDGDTFCQFYMSPDVTPRRQAVPIQASLSLAPFESNFNCNSKDDRIILNLNMQSRFNEAYLAKELIPFSPSSAAREIRDCEDDSAHYAYFLQDEFRDGMALHSIFNIFSLGEIRQILRLN